MASLTTMIIITMMMNYNDGHDYHDDDIDDDDVDDDDDAQVFLPCNDRKRWREGGRRPVSPSAKIIQVAFQNCHNHHHSRSFETSPT